MSVEKTLGAASLLELRQVERHFAVFFVMDDVLECLAVRHPSPPQLCRYLTGRCTICERHTTG